MSHRLVLAALVIAVTASQAAADAPATQVFPLSGSKLPAAHQGAPAQLTGAIVDALDAERSSVPIEDAAGLLMCDIETRECLEAVSRSIGGKQLVFGTVTEGFTALEVTLIRFQPGRAPERGTYELSSDDLSAELLRAAGPLLGRPVDVKPSAPVEDDPDDPELPSPARGTITTGTWALLGAGLALSGAGIGFHVSASGIRADIDNAPRNTVEDFQRLVQLEDAGRMRTRIGSALLVGGGIALIAGAVRAYTQLRVPPSRKAERLAVMPIDGGAAVTFTWRLR